MIASILFLLSLASTISATCTPQVVNDVTTQDTPAYNTGSVTNDILSMSFYYRTYGVETDISYPSGISTVGGLNWQRYIDSSQTGFVQVLDATAALCSSHLLANQIASAGSIAGIITYEDANCNDTLAASVGWSTVKADCGSLYFPSSGGTNGDPYVVKFVFRITYVEQLSSGDTRTVSNDYSFSVDSPTQFSVDSSTFQLANVATQVSQQVVLVDVSGKATLTLEAIAACDAVLTAVTIGALPSDFTTGTPTIMSSGSPGAAYASGTKYAGLCPYTWTLDVTPSGACALSGSFNVTYDFTPTGSSSPFTTPALVITLTSSDSCTIQQVSGSDWANNNFQLQLRTAADGLGGVLNANTVVNYGQTAHWEIVASKATSDVPKPIGFSINNIATMMGSGNTFSGTVPVSSSALQLSNNDGGTSGVSTAGTPTSYSLYWSHLWESTDFPSSSTRTNVTLRVTFDIAYPAVTKKSFTTPIRSRSFGPRRNFHERRVISRSTANFALVSPRFIVSSDKSSTTTQDSSSASLGLIVGVSVLGGVLVIGAAVAVFIIIMSKTAAAAGATTATTAAAVEAPSIVIQ